jgi:hypothetical protein
MSSGPSKVQKKNRDVFALAERPDRGWYGWLGIGKAGPILGGTWKAEAYLRVKNHAMEGQK